MVTELHALLERAGEVGPYVLVGHSLGGLNVQLFARNDGGRSVGGVVLVDATPADLFALFAEILTPEQLALALPPPERNREGVDIPASSQQVLHAPAFPAVPLAVLTHSVGPRAPGFPNEELERIWQELQLDHSRLSPQGTLVVAQGSRHFIQLDRPELVIDAILNVVEAARAKTRPGRGCGDTNHFHEQKIECKQRQNRIGVRCRGSAASPTHPLVECLGPAPQYSLLGLCVRVLISIMTTDAADAPARARQVASDWTKAAVLLEERWNHDRGVLTGTYRGYKVEAMAAYAPYMGQYDPRKCKYEVTLHANLGRDRWLVRGGQRRRRVLRVWPRMVARRLERTGVLDLVQPSMRCVAFARVRYSPRPKRLTYSDGTGRVPSPEVFGAHLEMLTKVVMLGTVGSRALWRT